MDLDEECICITIDPNLHHTLDISGCGSLMPELVPATGPKIRLTALQRVLKRLSIHIGQHQDFFCLCILHNRRDKSAGIELDFG